MSGKLTLVGAGPGDPELITLKGVRALKEADVVLYDALANEELLQYAENAEKIFVGKRRGMHKFIQEKIQELIVEHASQGKHVVRLKGGDPFIFGRGAEELKYVLEKGIDFEIVSGVTSAIAAPASYGISLTQRGVNESFRVITGTTSDLELSNDIEAAAKSNVTIVVLMGMSKLEKIVNAFIKQGKTEIPVAIIENGTKDIERLAIGNISTILEIINQKGLTNPSMIVIGETVKQSEVLYQYLLKKKGQTI
ncbi:uroporphyrinogen-III C-methyltransferase [Wenyingzhuangia marina]|uniref:uroporphyrinogen-III C-methyltransferase n=1 Tax=Wenyingzhuangia marina TaxID=1195760 RepID=A0A1M5WGL4_9FLAO|nr:uroporphyrinogen-III C-methyltransferase [Wenyingzhuangia marina]GGF81067.1 uroporphyrinogen-III C-methyltransferase [Wenyingzhuangia marina]SHH86547.1 uroporphyrin-III C-methyltransferase [Wenyingzhuangia marina]